MADTWSEPEQPAMSEAVLLFILLLKGVCERLLGRRLLKVILCCQGILLSLHQLRTQQAPQLEKI